jgi:hypothetical protein
LQVASSGEPLVGDVWGQELRFAADDLETVTAGGVARETGETAARGTWSVDYPEAELVPIEFFDDMQLEDEFFDRDLVIGGDVYDPQVWLERPGAVAGEGMEGLKRDMAEHGLDHPLTVRVDPESGAMNLVDGNHRVVAARELGWGSVPVVVERGDDITRIRPSQVGMPTAVARTVVGETAPTLDAFTEMAGRGELHGAKGSTRIEWRTTAVRASPIEAQADTAFEMGVINGYSEDDIAHFYLALRAPWNKARTAKNVGAVRDDMRELAYEQFLEDRAEYLAKQPAGGVARETGYRGMHTSPQRLFSEGGDTLDDLSGIYPDDVYGPDAPRLYGSHGSEYSKPNRTMKEVLHSVRGNPDAEVEVFRAVPEGVTEINPGDWVSPSRDYAVIHGEGPMRGDYQIISRKVRAGDLFTEANSLYEFGWDPS